jgi:signal transduction histidine kinase
LPGSTFLLAAGLTAAYGLLVAILARQRHRPRSFGAQRWLILTLVAALVGAAIHILPRDAHTRSHYQILFVGDLTQPGLAIIAANLMLVLFGAHILRYVRSRGAIPWTVVGLVWWVAQAVASIFTPHLSIGQAGWYGSIYDPLEWPNGLAFGGWLVIGVLLIVAALYQFYRARLPELANRALFGAILVPLVVVGVALGASGGHTLDPIGGLVQAVGLVGAVYSATAFHVLDIRRTFRQAAAIAILILVTALVFFGALAAAVRLDTGMKGLYAVLAALALAVAVIYIPFRWLGYALARRLVGGSTEKLSQQLRRFSEDIAGVLELNNLVDVTMITLGQVLRVRRGGLILVTEEQDDTLKIMPIPRGMGEIPDIKGQIACTSPIYDQLQKRRSPVLQYDLDFGPTYTDVPPFERRFFQQMRMSAYAPVVVQGHLVGILCCGAKASDDPFTEHDLEVLMTIANQTGVALRNARLVADLRRREAEQAELNRALSATKDQLEQLDGVKTDFITIASHELRTPLAQIRGYTDIMEAMNEDGTLDPDQMAGMMANLRKAADRLEGLIAAMLDVSQLDVNAMDLRFAPVAVENAMRMAIEPLTESIKGRKLMLSARGLRDLPPIQGDMQRLVQAFRNVVLNAIKYTPDGGRIDISGRMQDDNVLVMIKDSGIGIDPTHHELIFEKFFRVQDPSLHSTGTTKFMGAGPGLGLTIARGVITAHGGRIWVESERFDPETLPGSTFYIQLPLNPPESTDRAAPFDSVVSLSVRGRQRIAKAAAQEPEPEASPTLMRPPAGLREDS